ncbi:MAG: hypothetical protein IIC24_06645, partial [Chloroflexi bacterium]|nr:hypothetical protein [Chloroflexota bacterium]
MVAVSSGPTPVFASSPQDDHINVVLYQGLDQTGNHRSFSLGADVDCLIGVDFDGTSVDMNDEVASIRVPAGLKVTLLGECPDPNPGDFTGGLVEVTFVADEGDVSDFGFTFGSGQGVSGLLVESNFDVALNSRASGGELGQHDTDLKGRADDIDSAVNDIDDKLVDRLDVKVS